MELTGQNSMRTWTYPESILDRAEALLGLLGSFWSRAYAGRATLGSHLLDRGVLARQNLQLLTEATACISRRFTPPLALRLWQPITLTESERVGAAPPLGSAGDLGGGAAFGVGTGYAWPLPDEIYDLPLLCASASGRGTCLARGTDFLVDRSDSLVVFRADPFADATLTPELVVDDAGIETDRTLTLWAFRAGVDAGYLYGHWGYLLGLYAPTSDAYRDVINAALDAAAQGPALRQAEALLSALTGVPLAVGDETVEAVFQSPLALFVVTDQAVYEFAPGANPVVAAGDRVSAGSPLTDGLTVHLLNRGETPDDLRALAVGPGLLAGGLTGEVVFEDAEVPLAVTSAGGRTRVAFALGGRPDDVMAFWDLTHANGLASGTTLANLLDRRAVPDGDPGPESLPASVNPLRFLVENVLRYNAWVVRVRAAAVSAGARSLNPAGSLLRRMVTPWSLLILAVEAEAGLDPLPRPAGGLAEAFDAALAGGDSLDRARLEGGPPAAWPVTP